MKVEDFKVNLGRPQGTISGLLAVLLWVAGMIIAKGFWSMFFAILVPPYSYYLVLELLMVKFGLLIA